MATVSDNPLPEYYLLKLSREDGIHYVFAETAASFNTGRIGENSKLLDALWADRKGKDTANKLSVDGASLPQPGGSTEEWSYFSTKKQSGKKTQSG
jgi:hypothetical protein